MSVVKLIGLFLLESVGNRDSWFILVPNQLTVCYQLRYLQQIVVTLVVVAATCIKYISFSLIYLLFYLSFSLVAAPVNLSKRPFWIMTSWRTWIWRKYVKLLIACIRLSIQLRIWSSRREMWAALCMLWKVSWIIFSP